MKIPGATVRGEKSGLNPPGAPAGRLGVLYLQGVVRVHHPAVCPGGGDQKAGREEGKEAAQVLQEVPHVLRKEGVPLPKRGPAPQPHLLRRRGLGSAAPVGHPGTFWLPFFLCAHDPRKPTGPQVLQPEQGGRGRGSRKGAGASC